MYLYVCVNVCMYMYRHRYIYTCMHICICIYIHMCNILYIYSFKDAVPKLHRAGHHVRPSSSICQRFVILERSGLITYHGFCTFGLQLEKCSAALRSSSFVSVGAW